jgi:hypothetical protein
MRSSNRLRALSICSLPGFAVVDSALHKKQKGENKMRVLLLLLVLWVSAISAPAQSSDSATVPMQFRGHVPIVDVMINGQGPFLFMIDTGGGLAADFDTALVAKLKLPTNGKVRAGDPSGQNAREFDTVAVESIKLGNVEFRNVTALARERTGPNAPEVSGILGFPLFAEFLLTLDYPGKQVRLARGELPQANGANILSFEMPRRIPVVDLMIGSLKVRAHLDSGNLVGAFIVPTALLDKLDLVSAPVTVGRARTVANEVEIKQAQLGETITLGSFEFPKPTITFPALDETNIGLKTLREFTLTFDQKNKRMKLTRPAPAMDGAKTAMAFEGKDYVGRYGEREISFDGKSLYLQREGGSKMKLASTAKDEFTLELVPEARIVFVREQSGSVSELRVLNRAGGWETSRKSQP